MSWTKTNFPMAMVGSGGPSEGLWTPTVDQLHRLGEKYDDSLGRRWRYARNGAAILAAGYMSGKEATHANVLDEAQTSYGTAAIGDTRVTVVVATGNGITNDELIDGTLLVEDSTGYLHAYAIAGNTYITSDTIMSVELHDPIRVAWSATTVITLSKNMYADVVVMGTTPTGIACGVPNVAIPIGYYGWLQRKGSCAMYADTGTTLAIGCLCGNPTAATTAGSVEATAVDEALYGHVIEIGAQTKGCLIYLQLE